jgi:hypothetical protein
MSKKCPNFLCDRRTLVRSDVHNSGFPKFEDRQAKSIDALCASIMLLLLCTSEAQGLVPPQQGKLLIVYTTAYLYTAKNFDHGVEAPSTIDPLKEPNFTHEVVNLTPPTQQ